MKKFQQVTPEYEVPNCIPTTQNPRFRAEVPNKHLPWVGHLCRVKQYQGGVFRAECNNPDTNSISPSQNRRRQFFKKQAYQSASHLILRTIPWRWKKGLLSHLLDGKTQAQRWETPQVSHERAMSEPGARSTISQCWRGLEFLSRIKRIRGTGGLSNEELICYYNVSETLVSITVI